MRRRDLLFGALAAALPGAAAAQSRGRVPHIGLVGSPGEWAPFLSQLKDLGYVEGRNVVLTVDADTGQGEEPYAAAVADLVRRQVDIIVASSGIAGGLAAMRATSRVPIVIVRMTDPVRMGLTPSLARPGGNVTGFNTQSAELSAKRIELLKEIVPGVSRIVVLGVEETAALALSLEQSEVAARALGVTLSPIGVRRGEFDAVAPQLLAARPDALLVLQGLGVDHAALFAFALRNRLPTVTIERISAEAGGLMSYGPSYAELFRRAAIYVDKILRGANPADLPIEQPTKFELVINMKTAAALGIAVPLSFLARADEVIE